MILKSHPSNRETSVSIPDSSSPSQFAPLLEGYSIEVMPRTAAKVDSFKNLLPSNATVYVAHIEGTPLKDMLETCKRIRSEGFPVKPHITARAIRNHRQLEEIVSSYRHEADISSALLLAGGIQSPYGEFDSSIQLLESGLFEKYGYTDLHVAGHPEGNRDIDENGGTTIVDSSLLEKQEFAKNSGIRMAVVTQFAFDPKAVIGWLNRMHDLGVWLPVHVGLAGPAKLQTLLKYAIQCGVGPSLQVLRRRARDVTKLLKPFEPTHMMTELSKHTDEAATTNIAGVHFFPLGGIKACANWANQHTNGRARPHEETAL